jgi:hypothetical protein
MKKTLNLLHLPRSQEHMSALINIYLDPKFPRKVTFKRYGGEMFQATGRGYDGEMQVIRIYSRGEGSRFYLDSKGYFKDRLPFETGKVLNMLKSLGYELRSDCTRIANRYKHYLETGISHLDTREQELTV